MSRVKEDIMSGMIGSIPNELLDMFDTPFGIFTEIEIPTTEESANIAVGKMCAEINNNILIPLSGFPMIMALMYLGSFNPPVIASLFAGLELATQALDPDFEFLFPVDGAVGLFDDNFSLTAAVSVKNEENLLSLTGASSTGEQVDFSGSEGTYTASFSIPVGADIPETSEWTLSYTITAVGTFQDPDDETKKIVKTVSTSFSIAKGEGVEGGGGESGGGGASGSW